MGYLIASPVTTLGLVLALCSWRAGAQVRVRSGVVEVWGAGARRITDRLAPPGWRIRALTLGHVVFARDAAALESTREHERVHVRQYERWGAALLPAYVVSAVAAWLADAEPYSEGVFERATRTTR